MGDNGNINHSYDIWVCLHMFIFYFFSMVFTPSRHDHFDREHDNQLI